MKHLKTWLIEKEWDVSNTTGDNVYPVREKKIAFGYTNLERAKKDCEQLNKECANCPRRTALHTTYKVLDNAIHVRMLTADETYHDKSRTIN